jgi:hypothetical protein
MITPRTLLEVRDLVKFPMQTVDLTLFVPAVFNPITQNVLHVEHEKALTPTLDLNHDQVFNPLTIRLLKDIPGERVDPQRNRRVPAPLARERGSAHKEACEAESKRSAVHDLAIQTI